MLKYTPAPHILHGAVGVCVLYSHAFHMHSLCCECSRLHLAVFMWRIVEQFPSIFITCMLGVVSMWDASNSNEQTVL